MWVFPSHSRPAMCQSVLDAMVLHGSTAYGAVYACEDDAEIDGYRNLRLPYGWELVVMPSGQPWQTDKLNHAVQYRPNEPWYGWIADDLVVKTEFEGPLVRAAGRWGIASANDEWQASHNVIKGRMHGATVFGGDFIRSMGYWVVPTLRHQRIDDAWEMIGRELGNWQTLMGVVTAHNHPYKDGVKGDITHHRVNNADAAQRDKAAFNAWVSEEYPDLIHRVRMEMWAAHGLLIENARQRSVLFGLPVYEKVSPQREAALMDAVCVLAQLGIKCGHAYAVGQPIHVARNNIADAFMRSDFTDLLFIDSDMSFSPWDVVKLIAAPHDLIAGVGRKRSERGDDESEAWCFGVSQEDVHTDHHGMMQVDQVGTGFMRIRKPVFQSIVDAMPGLIRYRDDEKKKEYVAYFEWSQDAEQDIGEDFTFCRRYVETGGKVFIDPSITLGHFGNKEWKASVRSVLSYQ